MKYDKPETIRQSPVFVARIVVRETGLEMHPAFAWGKKQC